MFFLLDCDYFPTQNLVKISSIIFSLSLLPVMSPRLSQIFLISIEIRSNWLPVSKLLIAVNVCSFPLFRASICRVLVITKELLFMFFERLCNGNE